MKTHTHKEHFWGFWAYLTQRDIVVNVYKVTSKSSKTKKKKKRELFKHGIAAGQQE